MPRTDRLAGHPRRRLGRRHDLRRVDQQQPRHDGHSRAMSRPKPSMILRTHLRRAARLLTAPAEDGVAAIEFAITGMVFLMIVTATVDIGCSCSRDPQLDTDGRRRRRIRRNSATTRTSNPSGSTRSLHIVSDVNGSAWAPARSTSTTANKQARDCYLPNGTPGIGHRAAPSTYGSACTRAASTAGRDDHHELERSFSPLFSGPALSQSGTISRRALVETQWSDKRRAFWGVTRWRDGGRVLAGGADVSDAGLRAPSIRPVSLDKRPCRNRHRQRAIRSDRAGHAPTSSPCASAVDHGVFLASRRARGVWTLGASPSRRAARLHGSLAGDTDQPLARVVRICSSSRRRRHPDRVRLLSERLHNWYNLSKRLRRSFLIRTVPRKSGPGGRYFALPAVDTRFRRHALEGRWEFVG